MRIVFQVPCVKKFVCGGHKREVEIHRKTQDYAVESSRFKSDQQRTPRTLRGLLEDSQKMLIDYFKNIVDGNDAAKQALLNTNKAVKGMVEKGMIDYKKAVESILSELIEKKIRFPNAEDLVGSIDVVTDYYDVSDELLHENLEFKSYLKQLSEAKGDFSEETIRKFSAAFEQAGV